MRILRDILKRVLGFKLLRRLTSALILMLADGLALAIGLGVAAWGGRSDPAIGLAPLLLAAWITLFSAFRLYDRAPVRRSPGGLLGAAFCWAGLATIGATIYPESGLGARRDSVGCRIRLAVLRRAQVPLRARHR